MARPRKCRKVCRMPQISEFHPANGAGCEAPVILTVDEYEAIRLIDLEGLSQEECGSNMKIARTTVQQIYAAARRKLAEVLVRGAVLRIEGGDYQLCEGDTGCCGCEGCCKYRRCAQHQQDEEETE